MVYAPQMAPHHNPEIQAMFDEVVDEALTKTLTKTARTMLADGMPEDKVAKYTSLPIEKVRKLKST